MPAYGKITGTYQREAGARRAYAYQVIYEAPGEYLEWQAMVMHEGEIRGTPRGKLYVTPTMLNVQRTVREAVEIAIEQLLDVRE